MTEEVHKNKEISEIEQSILEAVTNINNAIESIPKENQRFIQPVIPHFAELIQIFQQLMHLLNNGQFVNQEMTEDSLIDVDKDAFGLYFKLGAEIPEAVKARFFELREQLNELDNQYAKGEISSVEFNMMREIYTSKLVELVRMAII
ncbi:MAG: hypothetical protein OEZ01_09405 [Candidatus Heimdallarchaeota archaeon]|nr:hypothetical protein [Candidatus Heimdallarchaeota archaeon]MDH5646212.1 hypothetical protein [Candidatus Heimdallarchaeota archaeon]